MSSMNFSSAKQSVKPPQRGIFPLDHDAECKPFMKVRLVLFFICLVCECIMYLKKRFHVQKYISCLKDHQDKHHLCRDASKEYLQCRMDRELMAKEDLDQVRPQLLLIVTL